MSAPMVLRALLAARTPLLLDGARAVASVHAAAASGSLPSVSLQPLLSSDRRGLAEQAAQAQEGSDASAGPAPADDELAVLKAAVDKFLPDTAMQEAFRINEVSRLRLADLPATRQFMESFAGGKLPSQPLYDLPSWLEHSYPQYDASPKGPWYSWVAWARDNLPREHQRLLHAFHDYMQDDKFRAGILRQANYELARLWQWQHQRAAAGLPPDLTPAEQQAAAARTAAAAGPADDVASSVSSSTSASSSSQTHQARGSGSPSTSGSASGAAAAASAATEEPKPAPKPKPAAAGPLSGILGIIQQADKKQQEAETESREQLAAQGLKDLTPEQRTLVASLKSVDSELRNLVRSFDDRLARGQDVLRGMGQSRVKDLLRGELETRTAAVVEATNSGQDYKDIESRTTLYNAKGDTLDATGPGIEPQLRRLFPQDLRQALEGHGLWTDSQLLDIEGNQRAAAEQSSQLHRAVQEVQAADERVRRRLHTHGYKWGLSVRPPTPTLDRLTEYLQVKYMDVLLQRQDAQHLLQHLPSEQQQQRHWEGLMAQPPAPNAWRALSPEEVRDLNLNATRAFEDIGRSGSVAAYAALMRRLHADGIIGQAELQESLEAAHLRAAEARAAARSTSTTSTSTPTATSLLHLLTGSPSGTNPTIASSPSPGGAVASPVGAGAEAEVEAKRLWEEGARTAFGGWSKALSQHVKADIAARRAQGEQLSEQQEAELLAWWQQPVPFSEAQQAWSSYLAAAGMPHGPRLEEVILADQKARAKGAAGAGEEAGRVQAVSEQLREVFEAFAARHGSTLYGSGGSAGASGTVTSSENPSPRGGASETSGASGTTETSGAGGSWGGDLSWEEVQRLNAGLDVTSGEALASSFSAPSLRDVLRRHWQDTARTFLPAASAAAGSVEGVDSAAAPAPNSLRSFEDLWQLMLQVYDTTLSQASASTPAPGGTASASTPAAAAGSSGSGSTGGGVPVAAQGADGVLSRAEQQWGPYVEEMAGQASGVYTVPGSPPYPGAQPILRFRQTFVLSATPSPSATSVATSGFGPSAQPGSLDSHPSNRGVELRVRLSELQREAGLSDEAMQLLADVCGPDRLDAKHGEVVLRADCYAAREENRRLLLQQLHTLITEVQTFAPSPQASPLQRLLASVSK